LAFVSSGNNDPQNRKASRHGLGIAGVKAAGDVDARRQIGVEIDAAQLLASRAGGPRVHLEQERSPRLVPYDSVAGRLNAGYALKAVLGGGYVAWH